MTFDLTHKGLTTLEGIELSDDIRKLHLQYNHLKDITNVRFPERLRALYLDRNLLENLDNVRFPEGLQILWLDQNRLENLDNVQFPEGLQELSLSNNLLENLDNVRFPEGLQYLYLHQNLLENLENLYISPTTRIISDDDNKIREAVRLTCTRAIFGTPSVNHISLGAWWARVSYLTGGVTYLTLDEAFYKKMKTMWAKKLNRYPDLTLRW